tara:strand:+ start:1217 stop:1762 length:546 start_codon:yes stop_codon:yes gene_type:complete
MSDDYKKLATETFNLHKKIQEETSKLKEMKKDLLKKMSENNVKDLTVDGGKIKVFQWKSAFTSILKKEFTKIGDDKKKELLDKGLVKLHYRLNTSEYQVIKNRDDKTDIDEYVVKRNNKTFLQFKIDKNKIQSSPEIIIDDKDYNNELAEELLAEIKPDPIYFEDDGDELPQHERDYKGYD